MRHTIGTTRGIKCVNTSCASRYQTNCRKQRGIVGGDVCTLANDTGRVLVGMTRVDERRLAIDNVSVLVKRARVSSRISKKEGCGTY